MKKKHLITSALPYINGIKHIGNLVGSMLPADVYARYLRLIGEEVLYICATDEHGTPAELAAREEEMSVKRYCDMQYLKQKEIYQKFNLSFDYFGRTSSKQNAELTQHFAKVLENNGFIEKKEISQMYSIDDEMFLADRYIEGTCPHCNSDKARGDQCDGCGALLDPVDLINPKSSVSKSTNLELRKTTHLFLKQSVLINDITDWIEEHKDNWQDTVKNVAKASINQGIIDRCITRDLKWGCRLLIMKI